MGKLAARGQAQPSPRGVFEFRSRPTNGVLELIVYDAALEHAIAVDSESFGLKQHRVEVLAFGDEDATTRVAVDDVACPLVAIAIVFGRRRIWSHIMCASTTSAHSQISPAGC